MVSEDAQGAELSRDGRKVRCEELAERILGELDWESTGRLLSLAPAERASAIEELRDAALSLLPGVDLADSTLEGLYSNDLLLVEATLKQREIFSCAAASYALAHDENLSDQNSSHNFETLLLRFKLFHVLWLCNEFDHAHMLRCSRFACQTSKLLDLLWGAEDAPRGALVNLKVHLQARLGNLLENLEDFSGAERAFLEASLHAENPGDEVAYTARAASAMAKQGRLQEAYDLLELCRDKLEEVEDGEGREVWESVYFDLRNSLGGRPTSKDEPSLPLLRDLIEDQDEFMARGAAASRDALRSMRRLIPLLRAELEHDLAEDDVVTRHRVMIGLALDMYADENGVSSEADRLMSEAEALESRFTDEMPKVERRLLKARMLKHRGDIDESVAEFSSVLPKAKHLLPASKYEEACGYYLESLGCQLGSDVEDGDEIYRVVTELLAAFQAVMEEQPTSAARRHAREMSQRALETAVAVLISITTERDVETESVQRALALALDVIHAGRNVELQWPVKAPEGATELEQWVALEDELHACLRESYLRGDVTDKAWVSALEALSDFELTMMKDQKSLGRDSVQASEEAARDIHVALFKILDLWSDQPMLALSRVGNKLDGRFVVGPQGNLEEKLLHWSAQFTGAKSAVGIGRSVGRKSIGSHGEEIASPPPVHWLLPKSLVLTPMRPLGNLLKENKGEGRSGARPAGERWWYFYTDGLLSTVPIEMLPEALEDGVRFGQERSVVLCLRSEVVPGVKKRINLSGGWLGLGDVPEAGEICHLKGSGREVRRIADLLEDEGHPHKALLGSDASAEKLALELCKLRPAVLHLACHGIAHPEYPEACALVLADSPGLPERELLPYRKIRELPLAGVELVVLSACSGLPGRSGRAATMEGLAWAFLQAGATQVIASRYPVDDDATVRLMIDFYEALLRMPVAAALGRARDRGLTQHRLEPREVGAWSVWC